MVKFTPFVAASLAVLASVASAHEGHEESSSSGSHDDDDAADAGACTSTASAEVIAVLENVTYFDTCASGKTFKFTTLLDANKLSTSDFFAFCNSSTCLAPLHTVMHEASLTCLITYQGKAQNLTGEITDLHDHCHKVKDAAASTSDSGSKANATVTTPAPTKSAAASVNSKVFAVAIAGCAAVAALLL
ncbi:Gpi-anchored elicitin inl11b-like protein [Globisporangium polare]